MFLLHFCLTGETQNREGVLLHFSKRFLKCKPYLRGETFKSYDWLLYLAIKTEPMEWVQDESAWSEIGSGRVGGVGEQGQSKSLPPGGAGQDNPTGWVSFTNKLVAINFFLICSGQMCGLQEQEGLRHEEVLLWHQQQEDKAGYMTEEKYIMFTVYLITLRDLVLYCFKEEKTAQSQSSFESPHTADRIKSQHSHDSAGLH